VTLRHARLSTTARLETGARVRVERSPGCTGDARTGYTDLKSQMTRSAQSIVDNIVEGCGAASRLEFARDVRVISHDVWKPLAKEVIELRRKARGCWL